MNGERSPLAVYDPALAEIEREGTGDDEVAVIARLADVEALPEGLRVVTRFGDVVTLRVRRSRLAELAACEGVIAAEASRRLRRSGERAVPGALALDTAPAEDTGAAPAPEPETRRPPGVRATGRGTVVGVLDWGCDFAHPDLRHPDGSTRLLALWDQRGEADDGADNRWGFGRIHGAAAIDRALAADDPYRALGYDPADADPRGRRRGDTTGAHGTHVLSIAAGNGRGGGPSGVAPEADLVFVHLSRTTPVLGPGNLGDSAAVLEALDFVLSAAGERPCAVNLSVGAHGGPHDGSTLVEQGIDRAVTLRHGRAVINSAGNYRTRRAHAQGRLRPGGEALLAFRVPAGDPTDSEIELFYESTDRFGVSLIGPGGETLATLEPGEDAALVLAGRDVGHLYHRVRHLSGIGADRHLDLFLKPHAPGGVWGLRLRGERVSDGRYHAWIERDRGKRPVFVGPETRQGSTTGTLANATHSITVGAYDPHRPERPLGRFSSAGPTRDGRIKPEIVAPGVRILAARSTPRAQPPGGRYVRKGGTSMAAPHVAGAVAVMFEAAGRPLEIADTRALLLGSTDRPVAGDGDAAHRDLHGLGYGYLNIAGAEAAARRWGETPADGPVREGEDDDGNGNDGRPALPEPLEDAAALDTDTETETAMEDAPMEHPNTGAAPEAGDDAPERAPFGPRLREAVAADGPVGSPARLHELAFSLLHIGDDTPLVPVGHPGSRPQAPVRAGDLLLRPVPGGLHSAVVVSERPEHAAELAARGVPLEAAGPGRFVETVEVTAGGATRVVGRRLTDTAGRLPHGQWLLHPGAGGAAAGEGAREAAPPLPAEQTTHRAPRAVTDWRALIEFRVPAGIVKALLQGQMRGRRYYTVQTIESGRSDDINLDYYPVYVSRMPVIDGQRLTAAQLFRHFRTHLNDFIDTDEAEFAPASVADTVRWFSDKPLGAVIFIDIWGPDNAYVACSDVGAQHWRFSTLTQRRDVPDIQLGVVTHTDEHPVSGTREFGYVGTDARAVFYTKGADRGSYRIEALNRKAFSGGHKLWRSFQRKLVAVIDRHGGKAEEFMVGERGEPYISARHNWRRVRKALQ